MTAPLPVSAGVIARIRHHRKARGMSARALAEAITANGYLVHRSRLADQEAGRSQSVPVDLVEAAARVFKVPVISLLTDAPCTTCLDRPPRGFTCNACGSGAPTTNQEARP